MQNLVKNEVISKRSKKCVGFGPHLTLDLYGCSKKRLFDAELVANILDELPEVVGMHKICSPQVTVCPERENSFDKGGISAFVLIAESHMTIHTFPADGFASIDVFSCKPFDMDKATSYLLDRFEAKKAERNVIHRGKEFVKHYPKSIPKVNDIVDKERKNMEIEIKS